MKKLLVLALVGASLAVNAAPGSGKGRGNETRESKENKGREEKTHDVLANRASDGAKSAADTNKVTDGINALINKTSDTTLKSDLSQLAEVINGTKGSLTDKSSALNVAREVVENAKTMTPDQALSSALAKLTVDGRTVTREMFREACK